jgi:hypothetical protein
MKLERLLVQNTEGVIAGNRFVMTFPIYHSEAFLLTLPPHRLDVYYAGLYSLTGDELRYTSCSLDPKEKKIKQFGDVNC